MKKILKSALLLTVLSVILTIPLSNAVYEQNTDITSVFGITSLDENFAGTYTGKNGNLIVNYTMDEKTAQKGFSDVHGITYQKVEYNLKTLYEISLLYEKLMGQHGIKSVGIDVSQNAVEVTVTEEQYIDYLSRLSDGPVLFKVSNPILNSYFD